eukprot:gene7038-9610_t
MSWSFYITGSTSIFEDSYHRISIVIESVDHLRNIIQSENERIDLFELLKSGFHHITIKLTYPSNMKQVETLLSNMNHLHLLLNEESLVDISPEGKEYYSNSGTKNFLKTKIMFTLQIFDFSTELYNIILQNIDNLIFFDCFILNYNNFESVSNGREKFNNDMQYLILLKEKNPRLNIGFSGIEDQSEIDWILRYYPRNTFRVVHTGMVNNYPDLKSRKSELIHSYGTNTMIEFNQQDLTTLSELKPLVRLSGKYKTLPDTFVLKCLLQLGYIINIPFRSNQTYDKNYISNPIARLVHPFVHRKPVNSEFRLYSLLISLEDITEVLEMSQHEESKQDKVSETSSITESEKRVLSYTIK